jgi:hypothetical protein
MKKTKKAEATKILSIRFPEALKGAGKIGV